MKVSDYITSFLSGRNARHIFAISGAGNVHLLDSMTADPRLKIVCNHHEQASVMSAIAYARLSPFIGVALTTGGPGAINAFSGALDAWADSIPILIISGQEKSVFTRKENPLRMWGVQGFDVPRAVSGFTKYAVTILDPLSIKYHLEKALFLAFSGRPGPVWLDIPMDIQSAQVDPEKLEGYHAEPMPHTAQKGDVEKVLELLSNSQRPVILLGHGVRLSGALDLVPALLEKFPTAVLTSWAAADMVSSDFPRFFGHAGVYGQRCANFVLQNSDFFLSIGSRLAIPQVGYVADEFARDAKKIMVDIDPTELDKHSESFDLCVESDAGDFIKELISASEHTTFPTPHSWLARCEEWRRSYPLLDPEIHASQPGYVNSYEFIDCLSNHFNSDEVVVTDMGTALTCTHQAIKLSGTQRLVTSTGMGEMGFGLPGAIGACFANPGKRVILIVGDGSFMMNLQELQTIIHHKLPLKIFLYSNDAYLTIKHTQTALFEGRLAASDAESGVSCPNFEKVALAFGFRVTELNSSVSMDDAISKTLEGEDPVLCNIHMHPMQPLVPKVSFTMKHDGSLLSPPLEDLFPFLPRETLRHEMMIGMHPKSENL